MVLYPREGDAFASRVVDELFVGQIRPKLSIKLVVLSLGECHEDHLVGSGSVGLLISFVHRQHEGRVESVSQAGIYQCIDVVRRIEAVVLQAEPFFSGCLRRRHRKYQHLNIGCPDQGQRQGGRESARHSL